MVTTAGTVLTHIASQFAFSAHTAELTAGALHSSQML